MKHASVSLRAVIAIALSAGSAATAQSLTTTAPNNGNGGVFFDLTPGATALTVSSIATYFAGAAGSGVSLQVYTRTGTYVGNTASATGWTLTQTIAGTSNGAATPATLNLTTPILLPASQTTGVYIHETVAGVRYTGTAAAPPTTTFSNADLTLFSDTSRTGIVAFGGTAFTPRCFAGTINYSLANVIGACCKVDGTCQNTVLSGDCVTQNGTFQGPGSTCAAVTCPQRGACCAFDGTCTFVLLRLCTAAGSTFSGENVTCVAAACPKGACCRIDGTCAEVTSTWCSTTGGVFTANGTLCAGAGCPQPGACCLPNGGCVTVTSAECTASGGTFTANTLCAKANCWTTPVLYHNGGLVTHPGAGLGGADASLLAAGANSIGENWNQAANVRVSDDFTVPPGETWTVTKFRAFGYQTGATGTTTTPYTAMQVRIWDRDPRLAGAVVLWGDTTTNVLDAVNSPWANLYRVTAALTDNQRPLWDLRANVPSVVLNPGTYWVEFSGNNGVTPFTPPVCTPNYIPFGNAIIFRNAPYAPVTDTTFDAAHWSNAPGGKPVNIPFILEGTRATSGCYANCDNSTQPPILNVGDFTCFLQKFAAADPYANCDNSTQPPVLNVGDFTCFLQKFAAGCS